MSPISPNPRAKRAAEKVRFFGRFKNEFRTRSRTKAPAIDLVRSSVVRRDVCRYAALIIWPGGSGSAFVSNDLQCIGATPSERSHGRYGCGPTSLDLRTSLLRPGNPEILPKSTPQGKRTVNYKITFGRFAYASRVNVI